MPEKIAAAAIRVENEIYTAMTHFAVMKKIIEMPGLDPDKIPGMLLGGEDGFVTQEGRFVTRAEGFVIATTEHQVIQDEFADPNTNMIFYGTPEPSLDSGMIKAYAEFSVTHAWIR
jgi:hypothetical protein